MQPRTGGKLDFVSLCAEPDGVKQDSPESPMKLFVPPALKQPFVLEDKQEAEMSSGTLSSRAVEQGRTRM